MSFRAYLDNIQAKTGKTPADFRPMAAEKDFAGPEGIAKGLTATQINDWLKTVLDLGH